MEILIPKSVSDLIYTADCSIDIAAVHLAACSTPQVATSPEGGQLEELLQPPQSCVNVDFRGSSQEDDAVRQGRGWHEDVRATNKVLSFDSQGSM